MTKYYFLFIILLSALKLPFCQDLNKDRKEINIRGPEFKNTSVLADGLIYKLPISSTGIYKISHEILLNTDLQLGSSAETIKLYTNRGGLIPEDLSADRIDDLAEIPFIITGNDSSLDPGEFIIFYGEGADHFKLIGGSTEFEKNIYDVANYVFIKQSTSSRKKVETLPEASNFNKTVNTYFKTQRYEEDKTNLLGQYTSTQGSGKKWFGDYFGITRNRNYSEKFNFQNRISGSEVTVNFAFAGRSSSSHNLFLKLNGQDKSYLIPSVRTSNLESRYASLITKTEKFIVEGNEINLEIDYPSRNNNEGWLDYIEVESLHLLKYENEPFPIKLNYASTPGPLTIEIESDKNIIIWKTSDLQNIQQLPIKKNGSKVSATIDYEKPEIFWAFNQSDVPLYDGELQKIENQNLHNYRDATLVVVYHPLFEEEVQRFVNFREKQNMLTIAVAVDKIYNEFGSGKKDPVAIRDFVKMVYDRSSSFKYLLLVGDGSYDYKNVVPGLEDQNFIPAYETDESLHPIEAFPSDDFYALLSDNDGGDLRGQLEIAVGRLPVKNLQEARTVIDKIIRYESDPKTLGPWRLNIGFTADDEDFNTHFSQSERIANNTLQQAPLFNQQKVYFDAFEQVSTSGGARYPGASAKLSENVFNGQLVLNYLGHGGPRGWAQERVLKVNDILSWENYYKLPLLITATCSFTGYDDPALVSAGEHALLSEKGGAIGLMTTVRAVYSNDNFRLTAAVFDTLLSSGNGVELTIGDIMIRAKNQNWQDTTRVNARKFALIGDPSLKLAIPQYNVHTTSINNKDIASFSDTINALEKVIVEGVITDKNGQPLDNFKGKLYPTVYDKPLKLTTLQNDSRSRSSQFEQLNAVIFKGTTKVENGRFRFEFIVPKDINYQYGHGKISYYAISEDHKDASGHYSNLMIGGSQEETSVDNTGPEISLYMNNFDFIPGGITNSSPTLLIELFDESGINVSGNGIGHDLAAVLDNNLQNTYILNSFYQSEDNDFRKGLAAYPLTDLTPGEHIVKVKAWDVFNNSSESELSFVVIKNEEDLIRNLYNYPNPFLDETTFAFEHTLGDRDVEVTIDIFNTNGALIKTLRQNVLSDGFRIDGISWDRENDLGSVLTAGLYLYRVTLQTSEKTIQSTIQKMIAIH